MQSASPEPQQVIAAAPVRPFEGRVWRVHWREVEATDWSLSLRSSGRYHRGLDLFPAEGSFPALYTSLGPEIAIWEMVRRSAARNLAYLRNNVLSELVVSLTRVRDLTNLNDVGSSDVDLTGSDVRLCRGLGAAALANGDDGLLVPSAALPGMNLVVLPRNLSERVPIRVVRSIELPIELVSERPR